MQASQAQSNRICKDFWRCGGLWMQRVSHRWLYSAYMPPHLPLRCFTSNSSLTDSLTESEEHSSSIPHGLECLAILHYESSSKNSAVNTSILEEIAILLIMAHKLLFVRRPRGGRFEANHPEIRRKSTVLSQQLKELKRRPYFNVI